MLIKGLSVGVLAVGMMLPATTVVSAENYPTKPIRMLTGVAGSGVGFVARLIGQGLTASLGQQIVVDNRNLILAGEIVAQALPDGYTLLLLNGALWIGPLLEKRPYDAVRDFSPISLTTTSPNLIVVHPSLPAKTVKELIDLARAQPGKLNYASGPTGSANHLAGELFKVTADVNIVRIPYKGSGPAFLDLIGKRVELMFPTSGSVAPHLKSGRLRALAVTSASPSALFPGLPTVADTGLPGYEWASIDGVFAPAGTPGAIINRLNREIVRVLNQAEVKEKFFSTGVEVVGSSPEQFAAVIKSDLSRTGKLIKDAGIRAN